MLESYLEVQIANGIVFNSKLTFNSVHESVESGFQIFLMMAYFICPIALTFTIVFDRKSIEREAYWLKYFRQSKAYRDHLDDHFPIYRSYGKQIFGTIRIDKLSTLLLDVIFMARRAILALTLVFVSGYPLFQAMIFLMSTFAYMFYLGYVMPYKDKMTNRQEVFNEFLNL